MDRVDQCPRISRSVWVDVPAALTDGHANTARQYREGPAEDRRKATSVFEVAPFSQAFTSTLPPCLECLPRTRGFFFLLPRPRRERAGVRVEALQIVYQPPLIHRNVNAKRDCQSGHQRQT